MRLSTATQSRVLFGIPGFLPPLWLCDRILAAKMSHVRVRDGIGSRAPTEGSCRRSAKEPGKRMPKALLAVYECPEWDAYETGPLCVARRQRSCTVAGRRWMTGGRSRDVFSWLRITVGRLRTHLGDHGVAVCSQMWFMRPYEIAALPGTVAATALMRVSCVALATEGSSEASGKNG